MKLKVPQLRAIRGAIDVACATLHLWPVKLAHLSGLLESKAGDAVRALNSHQYVLCRTRLRECAALETKHHPLTLNDAVWQRALQEISEVLPTDHDLRNQQQKESLREEIKDKKNEPTSRKETVMPIPFVPTREAPGQGMDGNRERTGKNGGSDGATSERREPVQTSPVLGSLENPVGQNNGAVVFRPEPRSSTGPHQRIQDKDQERNIKTERNIKIAFWEAVIRQNKDEIQQAAKACAEAKMIDIVETCALHLVRIEEPIHRDTRRWAIEAFAEFLTKKERGS